jgi:hypothetical protein
MSNSTSSDSNYIQPGLNNNYLILIIVICSIFLIITMIIILYLNIKRKKVTIKHSQVNNYIEALELKYYLLNIFRNIV